MTPASLTTSSLKFELFASQGGKEAAVAIGDEVALGPGTVCLRLRVARIETNWNGATGSEYYAEGASDCSLRITANQVLTYPLAVVNYAVSEHVAGIGDIFRLPIRWAAPPPGPKCVRTIQVQGACGSRELSIARAAAPAPVRVPTGHLDGVARSGTHPIHDGRVARGIRDELR